MTEVLKGSYDIRIIRDNTEIECKYNNTILDNGFKLLTEEFVNNSSDSVINTLFLGTGHSLILTTTEDMSVPPIKSVRYTSYITPDFLDEKQDVFSNKLIFRFIADETFELKQLATGLIKDGDNKYFSMANVYREGDESRGIEIRRGDLVIITYEILHILGSIPTHSELTPQWHILRENRNWLLCGVKRRIEVCIPTLNRLYNTEFKYALSVSFTKNVYSAVSQELFYSISLTLTSDTTVSGPTFSFVDQGILSIGKTNSETFEAGVPKRVLNLSIPINSGRFNSLRYSPEDVDYSLKCQIHSFTGTIRPTTHGGIITLRVKTTKFASVFFLYSNSKLNKKAVTVDKLGNATIDVNVNDILLEGEEQLSKQFTCLVFNHANTVMSQPISISIPDENIFIEAAQYNSETTLLNIGYYRNRETVVVFSDVEIDHSTLSNRPRGIRPRYAVGNENIVHIKQGVYELSTYHLSRSDSYGIVQEDIAKFFSYHTDLVNINWAYAYTDYNITPSQTINLTSKFSNLSLTDNHHNVIGDIVKLSVTIKEYNNE